MQLYLAIGLPVFAFLLNIAPGVVQTNSLQARITSIETNVNARLASLESATNARFASLESNTNERLASIETSMNAHFNSIKMRFDTVTDKVVDIENRLTRVEERLHHS